jgi:hypothetical protein
LGPSFGYAELWTYEPLLGEGNVFSGVGSDGFMIGGKPGEINPLTGDTIIKKNGSAPESRSTAIEIEVWQIIKKE